MSDTAHFLSEQLFCSGIQALNFKNEGRVLKKNLLSEKAGFFLAVQELTKRSSLSLTNKKFLSLLSQHDRSRERSGSRDKLEIVTKF